MTSMKTMMRSGAAIIALAAAVLVQGCTMPQSSGSDVYTSDYAAALDNAMTSDFGGE
jgi:outer membrane lipoprotein SlyB